MTEPLSSNDIDRRQITVLRKAYYGDTAFRSFADVGRKAWHERADKEKYISTFGDEEIAIVLAARKGERSFAWFNERIPALDMRSASDVMANEVDGKSIIRSLLMRMP